MVFAGTPLAHIPGTKKAGWFKQQQQVMKQQQQQQQQVKPKSFQGPKDPPVTFEFGTASTTPVAPAKTSKGGKGGEVRPGDWTCPQCGANVFASKSSCFKCGYSRKSDMGGYASGKGGYRGGRGGGRGRGKS